MADNQIFDTDFDIEEDAFKTINASPPMFNWKELRQVLGLYPTLIIWS